MESKEDKYIMGIMVPGWLLGKGWIARTEVEKG